MKVVVAIDSLKNSLTSVEAGRAIEAGVRKAYGGHPVQVIVKPLADGGEGTVEALVDGLNGQLRYVGVQGPLGEAVSCPYGYLPGMETAVIEMAGAAGLGLVPEEQRNPLHTTTYGVGQVMAQAIEAGIRHFIIGLGGIMGGRTGIIIAFVIAMIMNVGSYWYSDKIVLSMYQARELSEDEAPMLHRMVAELSANAGIPKPRVCVIPEDAPNAFATGRDPEHGVVAVTDGIMRILSPEELRGVIAHEIGHIANRDILIQTIAGVLASVIVSIANFMQFAAIFGGSSNDEEGGTNPIAAFLLAILAPIAASIIQMAISRSREYLADETGARICGQPLALAGALHKLGVASGQIPMQNGNPSTEQMFIVSPLFGFGGGSMANLFSTHPPLEERIARLQEMSRQAR